MRIGNVVDLPQLTTPAAASAANRTYLYVKSDGLVYTKDSGGIERSMVDLATNQTITGVKTFSSNITAPNIVYSVTASGNMLSSGGQTPAITISATPSFTSATIPTLSGTVNTTGNLSENGNRVYSAGNVPPYPVTTVAGRTGAIVLAESDITNLVSDLASKYSATNLPPGNSDDQILIYMGAG